MCYLNLLRNEYFAKVAVKVAIVNSRSKVHGKMNYSPFRWSILMQFKLLEPPQFILLANQLIL